MSAQVGFALRGRNPDVLTCIANLSNDEVFTPPEFANRILDALPKELCSDKAARFRGRIRR
jgi:site-specific DNA-methyltransferase (adenine-specific)